MNNKVSFTFKSIILMSRYRGEVLKKNKLNPGKPIMNQDWSLEMSRVFHDNPPFWKPRGAWRKVYRRMRRHKIALTPQKKDKAGTKNWTRLKICSLWPFPYGKIPTSSELIMHNARITLRTTLPYQWYGLTCDSSSVAGASSSLYDN